ncbi:toll/interleukin-1 receptor domain-containing protein [Teredinibacter turnerae]|uniref:toll/interleukin-1 receptor domain-containing protein n=1 Tax=Teredinibacter turnerae TaxID=2426 RepID=UPI000425FEE1|nr:toll/interleukin-1 receptor domain-containing protein [Teredinibacter turnerae]
MTSNIFISHDHRDSECAKILANALSKITLRQIDAWFSTDADEFGGIQPGAIWLDEIRARLKSSKAIIVLVTPHSVSRPWVLFESGFGAGLATCDVVPIALGVDISTDIPFPLAMYQTYKVADYVSLCNLMARILNKYQIVFDEELSRPTLESTISSLSRAMAPASNSEGKADSEMSSYDLFDSLKTHIDRRFLGLASQILDGNARMGSELSSKLVEYEVPLKIRFSELNSDQYITINKSMSLQDVFDDVFYMLESVVTAFSYLEAWVLRNTQTNIYLVVREVASLIPAHHIFVPGSEWEALALDAPYSAERSSDFERWYRSS